LTGRFPFGSREPVCGIAGFLTAVLRRCFEARAGVTDGIDWLRSVRRVILAE